MLAFLASWLIIILVHPLRSKVPADFWTSGLWTSGLLQLHWPSGLLSVSGLLGIFCLPDILWDMWLESVFNGILASY